MLIFQDRTKTKYQLIQSGMTLKRSIHFHRHKITGKNINLQWQTARQFKYFHQPNVNEFARANPSVPPIARAVDCGSFRTNVQIQSAHFNACIDANVLLLARTLRLPIVIRLCFVSHPSSASSLSIVPLYSLKCDDRNSFGAHTQQQQQKNIVIIIIFYNNNMVLLVALLFFCTSV